MTYKKEPPAEDDFEEAEEDDARGETRRFGESRRRLPLAALVVLLALIAIGIYAAWPSIRDGLQTSAPEKMATASEESTNPPPMPEPVPAPTAKIEPPPALPDTPAAPPEPSPALMELSAQVAALQRALAERDAAPAPPPPDLAPIQEAMARLEEMERRLREAPTAAAVDNSTVANSASDPASAAMDVRTLARLDAVEKSLSALDADGAGADLDSLRSGQAELAAQIATLRRLYGAIGERGVESGRAMMLVLSLSRLSRAAALAAPFAREVEAFRAAAKAEEAGGLAVEAAIRELSAHALNGTPTFSQLAAAFDDVALAVIHADAEAEDQGWVDATIGRLRRIVTVRRVGGDIAADSLEGRLSALHHALASGDLADAIGLAEAMPIKARSGAEDWLRGAHARLAVDRALGVLDAELSARMAARWTAEARERE
ncbi:MAG: hypothetical protein O3B21_05450 [Proteobacteria bacterium]|nr:hypothetical protein [Pseudomonadota bacterium]MDA1355274.1 hypothetical protein [Pseudomonadota bacterium]